MDVDGVRGRVEAAGQGQVFRLWEQLDAAGRDRLLGQLAGIDFGLLSRLIGGKGGGVTPPADLEPAPVVPTPETAEERAEEGRARETGERALRAGRVAALVVAGGQGTRLGWEGPKGTFPIGPVSGNCLFQLQTEKVIAARRRYGRPIPWLIMTSPLNDRPTREFFAEHGHFGMPAEDVLIFSQGTMPVVDVDGHLLLDAPDHVAESPNGHGGVFSALRECGILAELRRRGVDLISYVQVDNVLVRVIDPVFIGRHVLAGAEMSSKVCRKRGSAERVAVIGRSGGRLSVIEYIDLPNDLARARRPDGELLYGMGSIAIHILSVDFAERMAAEGALPFHRARKTVPHLDDAGGRVEPAEPNAIKFEMFVFGALQAARESVTMEVVREEEFAPVKNAAGEDSPASARRAMTDRSARWLEAAGIDVPRDVAGRPAVPIEISPLLATDEEGFIQAAPKSVDFSAPVYLTAADNPTFDQGNEGA